MLGQILDYEGGGDLLNLLVERDTFPEDFTKFYIAEVCRYPCFIAIYHANPENRAYYAFCVDGSCHRGYS